MLTTGFSFLSEMRLTSIKKPLQKSGLVPGMGTEHYLPYFTSVYSLLPLQFNAVKSFIKIDIFLKNLILKKTVSKTVSKFYFCKKKIYYHGQD